MKAECLITLQFQFVLYLGVFSGKRVSAPEERLPVPAATGEEPIETGKSQAVSRGETELLTNRAVPLLWQNLHIASQTVQKTRLINSCWGFGESDQISSLLIPRV